MSAQKTKLQQLENELAELKINYKNVTSNLSFTINNSLNGILIVNTSGLIVLANPTAHHFFEKNENQLIGQDFGFPFLDSEKAELDIVQKNGAVIIVEMTVMDTIWNNEPCFLITLYDITDRVQSKKSLEKQKCQYQRIVETASEALCEIKKDGTIAYVNENFCKLIQYPQQKTIGNSIYDFLHMEYHAYVQNHLSNPNCTYPLRFDCKIQTKTNHTKWVIVSLSLIRDDDKTISGALSMMTDITDRKNSEEALSLLASKFNHFTDHTCLAFVEITSDYKIISWNSAAEKIFGYTKTEALNQSINLIIPTEERPNTNLIFQELASKSGSKEIKLFNQRKDGKLIYCLWMNELIRNSKGDIESIVLLVHDITKEHKRHEAIEESQKNLSAILSSIDAAVFTLDENIQISLSNKAAQRLFQYSERELVRMPFQKLLSKNYSTDFIQGILGFLTSSDNLFRNKKTQDIKAVRKNGEEFDTEISLTKIKIFGQEKLIALLLDITERKQHQQQLMRSQRLESIGLLTSGIVHEMNDVLTPIMLSIEYLKFAAKDLDLADCLNSLETSAKHGQELIEQLLTFARGKDTTHTLLNPYRLLYDVESIIHETFPQSIKTSIEISEELWLIITHPTEFHQILMNLCINSKHAMAKGGILSIKAENMVIDENYCKQHIDAKVGPYVVIHISDTGSGIPKDHLNKIFDPFFSTKPQGQGSGLGLSTVYSLMQNHGGFMQVSSKINEGTDVSLFFPASKPKEKTLIKPIKKDQLCGNGELILVVDDEPSILSITENILKRNNYNVVTAHEGSEATAIFAQKKQSIACCIIDMMMPVMDGYATIQALQAMRPEIKVLLISGLIDTYDLKRHFEKNVSYLNKPFTAQILLHSLQKLLAA